MLSSSSKPALITLVFAGVGYAQASPRPENKESVLGIWKFWLLPQHVKLCLVSMMVFRNLIAHPIGCPSAKVFGRHRASAAGWHAMPMGHLEDLLCSQGVLTWVRMPVLEAALFVKMFFYSPQLLTRCFRLDCSQIFPASRCPPFLILKHIAAACREACS